MPKKARELTALEVGRLKKPGTHAIGGVAGLILQIMPSVAHDDWCNLLLNGGLCNCEPFVLAQEITPC